MPTKAKKSSEDGEPGKKKGAAASGAKEAGTGDALTQAGTRIEPREITDELKESYLDYAMSVIVARALPDVRDGLKPVQRRILWAMWDDGLTHSARFRKSANVVGAVLGRYHPHGDMAVYDAMARMAQDFSLRYPLIHGQGNWGSVDGDPPAAQRYTEAKLSKIAEELLFDVEKETVEWAPNYDNSRVEPRCLPAKLPNLLLNGTVGIAVGMATSIPPHHLGEVADAAAFLIDHPEATISDLVDIIPGPDFPTGGVIYDRKAVEEAYASGKGSIVTRGRAEIMETKTGRGQIVITEIPYQVNKADLIVKMAALVQDKKLDGVKDIRDESDREGLRIVVDLKNDSAPQKILNRLYRYTDLQKSFHLNMIALMGGIQPELLSLKDILQAHIDHRKEVIRRRAEFDLKKAKERAHILEGLVKALDVIDQVISVIKKSEDRDSARENLIKKFKFTEAQANAILEMRLASLAALEREKLEAELKEKRALITELSAILASGKRILSIIKAELAALQKEYGGERRTKVVKGGVKEFSQEDLVPQEETIITLTRDGYVKRMPPDTFRSQERGGKGLIGFELKEEDQIASFIRATTHDSILFFTNRGKVFQTKVYEVPAASRVSRGKTVFNFLELPKDEGITAMIAHGPALDGAHLIMVTARGLIKKTPLKDFENVRRSGIIAITLKKNDELKWASISGGRDEVIIATVKGQAIRFKETDVRPMGRSASGVTAIKMRAGDSVAGADIIKSGGGNLLAVMAKGYGKQTPLTEYKVQKRGGSGIKTAKVTDKTGPIISAGIVNERFSELIAFSRLGQAIRIRISAVRVASRDTQGVKVMHLKTGDTLVGVACF